MKLLLLAEMPAWPEKVQGEPVGSVLELARPDLHLLEPWIEDRGLGPSAESISLCVGTMRPCHRRSSAG